MSASRGDPVVNRKFGEGLTEQRPKERTACHANVSGVAYSRSEEGEAWEWERVCYVFQLENSCLTMS